MRSASVHGGFTLVEVVVVIGIIILLVALTISVGVVVVEGSEVRQTETVLRQLDTALQEWQTHADRRVTWGENDTPPGAVYDMQGDANTGNSITSDVFVISELIDTVRRPSQVKEVLATIDPEFVHTYNPGPPYPPWINPADQNDLDNVWGVVHGSMNLPPSLAVLDAWGDPIYAIHPGPPDPNLPPGDIDGTMRIGNENEYGIAKNRQILFVSAGPDGDFGNLHLDTLFDSLSVDEKEEVLQASDNTYSYAPSVQRPEP
ncbi:MAG: hypothetical protein IH830_09220 [Planctomycetes bacterium]|nr:hypothetical protein [Planctomycetota bacterium]